jgi:hypothetical protein
MAVDDNDVLHGLFKKRHACTRRTRVDFASPPRLSYGAIIPNAFALVPIKPSLRSPTFGPHSAGSRAGLSSAFAARLAFDCIRSAAPPIPRPARRRSLMPSFPRPNRTARNFFHSPTRLIASLQQLHRRSSTSATPSRTRLHPLAAACVPPHITPTLSIRACMHETCCAHTCSRVGKLHIRRHRRTGIGRHRERSAFESIHP